MASNFDGEIVRDFIVEGGEILEKLGEELVTLDGSPRDIELLNSIFRGFHTIKGGASFLSIEPVVALCHGAEDLFSLYRSGERSVDSRDIDIVLRTVDELGAAFAELRNNAAPKPADPALLLDLRQSVSRLGGNASSGTAAAATSGAVERTDPPAGGQDQFTAAVAAGDATGTPSGGQGLHAPPGHQAGADTLAGAGLLAPPQFSDAEFEALLDRLHGKGSASTAPVVATPAGPGKATDRNRNEPSARAAETPIHAVPVPEPTDTGEKPLRQPEATLRIETRRLDAIMNLVGELVLARNRLLSLESLARDERTSKALNDLDLVISDLQVAVMKSRMQPIQKIFARFPRVVRDLARSLAKEVTLEISGEETDLEKNMVESLADPLVHLVRNAIDHGIETPGEREAAGKSRHGTVNLSAHQEGDRVVVTIADDGAGIDAARLRDAAVRKKMLDQMAADRLSDEACFELMFLPGLTTRQQASDISGRGVGMDVVRTKIEQLGGTIAVSSVPGSGTTIEIRLPLTLAILPTLMIGLEHQVFALPLSCVVEIVHINLAESRLVDGQPVIIIRGRPLPLFHLGEWLLRNPAGRSASVGQVVVVRIGPRHVAFAVDDLIGQEEVVIKPLGALVHGTKGLAGATITGDGRVALVLDIPELLSKHMMKMAAGA
ncbi:MAG: two-component system chemotaxis family sensor kinase CheA [Gammaproteobacteria bacterium]|nr:MAG: two-component system chemotaxis family sensor kinase CheA [Gammaproteobacteria bacterium]TND06746.1 MAG: two-component system, chemotaxis family, sensor kinase CheA [Gammaproteobacteria bacterium]